MRLLQPPAVHAIASAAALVLLLTACASQTETPVGEADVEPPAELVSAGTLTYGVAATFPPFEYKDGTELAGFDVEMAKELAATMGLDVAPMDMEFDGLIPALNGGRIDVINSAMYVTPERAEQVDFVPYVLVGEAVVTPEGNPQNISELPEDLSGLTVAVTRGAIGETYMNDFNEELEADGLDPMTILALPSNQDALLAVQTGRADAFDTSTPGAAYTLSQQPGKYEVAGTFDVGTEVGIAVRKGDTETKEALERALDLFVESGGYDELLTKHNLPAESNYFAGE